MSLNPTQFRDLIERVLTEIDKYSEPAVNLLLGTAAQESAFGTYIRQINGPALGVFQMEPNTEADCWMNYLLYRKALVGDIVRITGISMPNTWHLEGNLIYQIVMARVHYLRVSEPIPEDVPGMAEYWKEYYNTRLGKGTPGEFEKNYLRYVEG